LILSSISTIARSLEQSEFPSLPLSGARERQPTVLLALSASQCRRKKHFACYRPLGTQADRCNIHIFTNFSEGWHPRRLNTLSPLKKRKTRFEFAKLITYVFISIEYMGLMP
jgi:hypothetical protein